MKIDLLKGTPEPLGFSKQQDIVNFALFSSHANSVILGLFSGETLQKEISLTRTGDIWHVGLRGLPEGIDYAFRCEGPYDEKKGLLYKSDAWLADPYAKMLSHQTRAKATISKPFDWERVLSPKIPPQNLIIYEMHVRGFTQHPSSGVSKPGTYLGFIEKIPFLKKLGINAVELLPIFEFDRTHCKNVNPLTEEPLINYWGYHPLHFFAPMSWYATSDAVEEFKTLVRELHRNEIEVFLDVVYNHTGEGYEKDYLVNFRGLDNPVYYLVDQEGNYLNFTGCRNTVNANHPIVQQLILDSLRFWIEEMHVDGFRFDLASILTRDQKGDPIAYPPLLEKIAKDPVISQVKLIAEAWDAAGLYQLGSFPKWGPWSEWNGNYRDVVRRFIKGTDGTAGLFASALCGSEGIYDSSKTPISSINFITAHDGFSLHDLVTYEQKRNETNGENNQDGNDHNDNWNCGVEGPTQDPNILALRERQMRNFFLALLLSQGIPMLVMGDIYGHTRNGNNNSYVQDNETNWFLWDDLKENEKIFHFVSALIDFRKHHEQLHHTQFLTEQDIDWNGTDWSHGSRFVAFTLKGGNPFYAAFNANYLPKTVTLPEGSWKQVVHTAQDWVFNKEGESVSSTIELPHTLLFSQSPNNSLPKKENSLLYSGFDFPEKDDALFTCHFASLKSHQLQSESQR